MYKYCDEQNVMEMDFEGFIEIFLGLFGSFSS